MVATYQDQRCTSKTKCRVGKQFGQQENILHFAITVTCMHASGA